MGDFREYFPLAGQYDSLALLRHNPKNSVYLIWNRDDERASIPACFFTVSPEMHKEQLKLAAHHYNSLAGRLPLVPYQKCLLFDLPDGGHDVVMIFPLLASLNVQNTGYTQDRKLKLLLDIGNAVSALDAAGYGHSGLCPGNIITGGSPRLLGVFLDRRMSRYILPNPRCLPHAYTPPETAGDQAVSGGAGDVFSLGRIAYALFNGGALPDNPGDQTPPKDAPPWLAEIILRACQPAPALRWASLRHFCDALESHCVPAMPVVAMPVMPVVGIPKAPASAPPAPAEGGTASAAPENAEPESETREDHLSPEEMTGLYPALTPYFAVFDAQRSQTFRPPKAQARETMQMQIINRKKGLPWALIAAAACAAAVILYAVLTVILGLPTIG